MIDKSNRWKHRTQSNEGERNNHIDVVQVPKREERLQRYERRQRMISIVSYDLI